MKTNLYCHDRFQQIPWIDVTRKLWKYYWKTKHFQGWPKTKALKNQNRKRCNDDGTCMWLHCCLKMKCFMLPFYKIMKGFCYVNSVYQEGATLYIWTTCQHWDDTHMVLKWTMLLWLLYFITFLLLFCRKIWFFSSQTSFRLREKKNVNCM